MRCLIGLQKLNFGGFCRPYPGDTIQGGDTRIKLIFLWLNFERTLDKRHGKMGVARRRQLKKVIIGWHHQFLNRPRGHFQLDRSNSRWHHQLPPWGTPTLVTPLPVSSLLAAYCLLWIHILLVLVLQAPSYHLVFEAVLILMIIRLFFMKSYKPERTVLTEKVIQFLIVRLYFRW